MPSVKYTDEESLCHTDDLWADYADTKGIHIAEQDGGSHDARFALKLLRVASTSTSAELLGVRPDIPGHSGALRALFAALSPDQELEFLYRWQPGADGESRFDLHVLGGSTAADAMQASASALALHEDVLASLGACDTGQFEFTCVDHRLRPGTVARKSQWEIARPGIVVPCETRRGIGFMSGTTTPASVVVAPPAQPGGAGFRAFLNPGIVNDADLHLSIRVQPVSLDEPLLDRLQAAYRNVRGGSAGQTYFERASGGRILDDNHLSAVLFELERWLREPRGHRLSCQVFSSQRVPRSVLEMIGRDLFWDGQVEYTDRSGVAQQPGAVEAGQVRLDRCLHVSATPANLLPDAEALTACGIARGYAPAPPGMPRDGLRLGSCKQAGSDRAVLLADQDRDRHCYIIGATGTGKSTLLHHMVTQDIERGAGVCLIDPHGDLFADVLMSIPEHRVDDVVLIDLADFTHSVGLNFLECPGPHEDLQMNFVVNELLTIFNQLYNMELAGGPMFESYMRNALLTLMSDKERTATLLDVVRFFEDGGFRRRCKARSGNPMAASFWSRQAEVAGGELSLQNMAPYITSKLNQFTHNSLLRPIVAQRQSTIDFRAAMDDGRIVLVNLAKGLLGEFDTRLLGMLIIGKLFNAALGRAAMPLEERRLFNLYIDEFQALVTPTVIGLLSEARKFGLSLTMANQHLAQLMAADSASSVADAVLGNVATLLFFRVGPKDADKLEAFTNPVLSAQDLQRLPDHHVACRMVSRNVPLSPFVFCVEQQARLRQDHQRRIAESIRSRARCTYTRERAAVDKEVMSGWLR